MVEYHNSYVIIWEWIGDSLMNFNDVRLGIVIPSYNQGRYLERAIKSVLENVKYISADIVVMDGGSSDDSVCIIKKYENEFLFWTSEKDGGQGDAINKGMSHLLHCNYLTWLNSDDEYNSIYALRDALVFAVHNNLDVCYGKSYFIDKTGCKIGEYPTKHFSYRNLGNECYFSQPSVIFSTEKWRESGGINTELHMCLDYELWIRMTKMSNVGYFENFIGNTRIYSDTKTSTNSKRHLEEAICILKHYYGNVPDHWIRSYLKETKEIKNKFLLEIVTLFCKKNIIKSVEQNYVSLEKTLK